MNNIKTILIIDDNQLCLKISEKILKQEGYNVIKAKSGIKGLDLAIKKNPDLIILDLIMPTINGFETAQLFKEKNEVKNIPIIFLTSQDIKKFISEAFQVGGIDYIMKPVIKEELIARVEMQIKLRKRNNQLEKSNKIIKKKNKKLKKLLITDDLTKLYTRNYILEEINKSIEEFKENKNLFSLIMIDIDYFKKINDNFGHCCGDFILKKVSYLLRKNLSKTDIISRWGGEEFLILLPNTNLINAIKKANNLLQIIRKNEYIYDNNSISVTISLGIFAYKSNISIDKMIKKVDQKLYKAKNNGRNQIFY